MASDFIKLGIDNKYQKNISNAALYSGISKSISAAATGYYKGKSEAESREKNRELFKLEKQKRNNDLLFQQQRYKEYTSEAASEQRQSLLEARQLQQKLSIQESNSKLNELKRSERKNRIYRAFDKFQEDGDIKHLNNGFSEEDKKFMNIFRLDKVDTEATDSENIELQKVILEKYSEVNGKKYSSFQELMEEKGALTFKQKQEFNKKIRRFVIVTRFDGTREIRDVAVLMGKTDYVNQLTEQGRKNMEATLSLKEKAQIDNINVKTDQIRQQIEQDKNLAPGKVEGQKLGNEGQRLANEGQRLANERERYIRDNPIIENGQELTGKAYDLRAIKDSNNILRGYNPKNPTNEQKNALETLRIISPLSNKTQEFIYNNAPIAKLANLASNLQPTETGLFDNFINKNIDKFIGKEGGINYAAFLQLIAKERHTLLGAAQTKNEAKMFDETYGHLGLQYEAILERLKAHFLSIKQGYKTRRKNENEYLFDSVASEDYNLILISLANIDGNLAAIKFDGDRAKKEFEKAKNKSLELNKVPNTAEANTAEANTAEAKNKENGEENNIGNL